MSQDFSERLLLVLNRLVWVRELTREDRPLDFLITTNPLTKYIENNSDQKVP